MLNSVYGTQEILSLVMTDLALRKIGLEHLVMIASNSMTFKADFLNRVNETNLVEFTFPSTYQICIFAGSYEHRARIPSVQPDRFHDVSMQSYQYVQYMRVMRRESKCRLFRQGEHRCHFILQSRLR